MSVAGDLVPQNLTGGDVKPDVAKEIEGALFSSAPGEKVGKARGR